MSYGRSSKKPGRKRNSPKRGKGKNRGSQHRDEYFLSKKGKKSQKPLSMSLDPSQGLQEVKAAREKTETRLSHFQVESEKILGAPRPVDPPMDPWQAQALECLTNGENVIVDAPTTAGKTRVVEEFFKLNVDKPGFRAAYTTPVKSLSNDKLREFSEMFGTENVGIATGDVKENLNAPIVVATLESYRNSLLGVEPDLGRSLVIFDEYHFMQDSSRGSAWEEAIILSPPSCQLLLLSASVENAPDFCSWIEGLTHRTCRLVQTLTRPVPLEGLTFFREQWLLSDEVQKLSPRSQTRSSKFPLEQKEIARRLKSIPKMGLTPCIVYSGQRLACETMATEICSELEPLNKEQSLKIKEILENECEVDQPTRFMKTNLRKMLIMYGVGYHHSGIAPQGRRAVEILVKQGALRFCVATMGLSIGINFSVRSTLISDYRRPGEGGFTQYSVSEVLQMLGRAGRRGRDAVGYSLWPSPQSFYKLGNTKREECSSRLKNDPTTFLGLVGRGFKLRDIEQFYEKSFLRFGAKNVDFRLVRYETISKHLNQELPCTSPAHELVKLNSESKSMCEACNLRSACHKFIHYEFRGSLSDLHCHLHKLGCLDENDQLSNLGSIARYFPQGGGLLISTLIDREKITSSNLLAAVELMAALSLARFKEPSGSPKYKFPFEAKKIDSWLEELYPIDLFEELYDPANPRRDFPVIREFNPAAGEIVRDWILGLEWQKLKTKFCHEKFAEGDLISILYRSATYLQSLIQAGVPTLSPLANSLRDEMLKEPLIPTSRLSSTNDEEAGEK